jgi:hypothetical protein
MSEDRRVDMQHTGDIILKLRMTPKPRVQLTRFPPTLQQMFDFRRTVSHTDTATILVRRTTCVSAVLDSCGTSNA